MISPKNVKKEAQRKENENIKFCTYLKCHAEAEKLDQQFLCLHNELFEDFDCSKCRNCCKVYHGSFPIEDIERATEKLDISKEKLISFYLKKDEITGIYETKHMPCDFFEENGECKLGDCRPDSCKNYPYTNQPERLFSLYSVLEAVEVCPVAFEIYERLKAEYGFRSKS